LALPAAAVVAVDLAQRPVAAAVLLLVELELVVDPAQHRALPALLLELAADLAHKPLVARALLQVVAVLVPLLAVVAVELLLSRQSS
jgi:hypothetical protein